VLNALSPIDYSEARGTLTQLVTSTSIRCAPGEIHSVEVWSNRYIDDELLTCGALLRFEYELINHDTSHKETSDVVKRS